MKKIELPIKYEMPIMALKISQKQYCEDFFEKGELHFSRVSTWRNENECRYGQLDKSEGCFCSSVDSNDSIFNRQEIKYYKEENNGRHNYYYSDNDLLACCFYGIQRSTFKGPIETNYKTKQDYIVISQSYFLDFYPELDKNEYEKIRDEEKPNVIIVFDFWKLCDEIKKELLKLGCKEKDIYMGPVYYRDKKSPFFFNCAHPIEYFLKDKSYERQNEFRILVSDNNQEFLKNFERQGFNLRIPNTKHISIIQDFYFKDVSIAIEGNKLLYELAVPVITNLYDHSFNELIGILLQTHQNMLPQGKLSPKEMDKMLTILEDIIYDKYSVVYDRDNMTLHNVPQNLLEELPEVYK